MHSSTQIEISDSDWEMDFNEQLSEKNNEDEINIDIISSMILIKTNQND